MAGRKFMRKRLPLALLAAALLCALNAQAHAQTNDTAAEVPHYEVGAHVYGVGGTGHSDLAEGGLGGRFTYNLNKYVAVDSELNVLFELDDAGSYFKGVHGFAGLKAGLRSKRIGVFAKARPGF